MRATMARSGILPQRGMSSMLSISVLLILMASGIVNHASAARFLTQSVRTSSTIPALAGQASTWAPPAQYAHQRVTVVPSTVSTAAISAAPAVLGVQMPSQLISGAWPTPTIPTVSKPPVVSSYGGPGAGFVANMPIVTAKPAGSMMAAAAPAMAAAAPQLPTTAAVPGSSSGGSSSSSTISNPDVASRARLAAGFGALPQLPSLPLPAGTGAAAIPGNIANALSGAVSAAAQGASNAASGVSPAQFIQTAALGAQKFVQNDLPKLITAAAKDPNVQKGVQQLVSDLAAGKLPQLPQNLGDVAKQLNLPDEVTKGLSNIKLPSNLSEIKLPEVKLPEVKIPNPLVAGEMPRFELPKLDISKLNIPGFGTGTTGAQGLPQLPGLNALGARSVDDQLTGTRWTNPPVPAEDQYGRTGVAQLDAAKFMLGLSDYNPAQPSPAQSSAAAAAGHATSSTNAQQQKLQKQQQQQRVAAMRARRSNKAHQLATTADSAATAVRVQRRSNPAAAAAVKVAAAAATAANSTITDITSQTTSSNISSSPAAAAAQLAISSTNSSSSSSAPAAAATTALTAADTANATVDGTNTNTNTNTSSSSGGAVTAPAAAAAEDIVTVDITSSNVTATAVPSVTSDTADNAAADSSAENSSSSSTDVLATVAADTAASAPAAVLPDTADVMLSATNTTTSSSSSASEEQTVASSTTTTPAAAAAAAAPIATTTTTSSSSSSSSGPLPGTSLAASPLHVRRGSGRRTSNHGIADAAVEDFGVL